MPFDPSAPVSSFFSLSYAKYLVFPRSVMQAMPLGWQRDMVKLLEEAGEQHGRLYGDNDYEVKLVVGERDADGEPEAFRPDPLADYRHPIPELRRPPAVPDEEDDEDEDDGEYSTVIGLVVLAFAGLTLGMMYMALWAVRRDAELRAAGVIP